MFRNDWDKLLELEITKDYFKTIMNFLRDNQHEIYPASENIFKALQLTSYKDTKVVILGQDPYHGHNQANGLAFAVNEGIKNPPSLQNIIKELNSDLGINSNKIDFYKWANEGVLLLNSVLTVESAKPGSHQKIGWQQFTDEIIKLLNQKEEQIVFILWGNYAKSKETLITNPNHLIIKSSHPSPFSVNRGFLGSKPFSTANQFLGERSVKWY